MEADLWVGSYELLDVVCRAAQGDPAALVPEDEVISRVGWGERDVRLGLDQLVRVGLLQRAESGDASKRCLRVSTDGLGLRRGWGGAR